MKVLLAHDHQILKYKDKYYSTGGFTTNTLKRYTSIFGKLVFISRQKEVYQKHESYTLLEESNTTFYKVPNFKSLRYIYKEIEARKTIKKAVIECDYIITRLPSSIGFLALEYAKKYRKPYLIEVVACPWDSYWNHSTIGKFVAPIEYFKMRKAVKQSNYNIYVTNCFLQKRYPTLGTSISCSNVELVQHDFDVLNKRLKKIQKRNRGSKIVIGTVGGLNVKTKGQKYIIRALSDLKNEGYSNFEYQLVGGGDYSYLKGIAKRYGVLDQIKFVGNIPHNEIFSWLESIDIYTQPSKHEGLPRALIEAMSVGLPCFGSNVAGIPELLDKEFIFAHRGDRIDQIKNIILSFDCHTMMEQSRKNFVESQKYDFEVLKKKRTKYLLEFKNSALMNID